MTTPQTGNGDGHPWLTDGLGAVFIGLGVGFYLFERSHSNVCPSTLVVGGAGLLILVGAYLITPGLITRLSGIAGSVLQVWRGGRSP